MELRRSGARSQRPVTARQSPRRPETAEPIGFLDPLPQRSGGEDREERGGGEGSRDGERVGRALLFCSALQNVSDYHVLIVIAWYVWASLLRAGAIRVREFHR